MDPSDDREWGGRATLHARQALDALVYGFAVVVVIVVVSALVSFPVGSGWVGVKVALFVFGFLLLGLSTFQLWPTPPWKRDDEEGTSGEREETHFQALVQRIPPLRRYGLTPNERLSPAAKLFIASVLSLFVSFVMETGFGVKA